MNTELNQDRLKDIVDELNLSIQRVTALDGMLEQLEGKTLPEGTTLFFEDIEDSLKNISKKLGVLAGNGEFSNPLI